jgi:hypothetical protein
MQANVIQKPAAARPVPSQKIHHVMTEIRTQWTISVMAWASVLEKRKLIFAKLRAKQKCAKS